MMCSFLFSVKKRKRVADIPIPEKIPPPVRVEKNLSPIEKSPPPVSPVPVKSPVSRRNLCTISGSKRSRYSGKGQSQFLRGGVDMSTVLPTLVVSKLVNLLYCQWLRETRAVYRNFSWGGGGGGGAKLM